VTNRELTGLLKSAAAKWSGHDAPRLGAALAYYSLLSIAPLLILVVAMCGVVFTKSMAERQILQQIQNVAGYASAQTLETLIANAHHSQHGVLATVIALVTLLFGASGIFVELRASLNKIWDAPPRKSSGWRDWVWQRLVAFGMVLGFGFLLLGSLVLSAGLTFLQKLLGGFVPLHFAILSEIANHVLSLVAMTVLFGLVFKFMPDVPINWGDVTVGAVATAIFFEIGKALLALYLGTAGVGSTYGAAGSLVALVVWVYYSSQIFFFGAEFTRVYADRLGSPTTKKQRSQVRRSSAVAANESHKLT
jgi:membrane protein